MANRNLKCIDCGDTKWLSQQQWKAKINKEGSNHKVKRRFICKSCEMLKRDDPFKYQLSHGKPLKKLKQE